MRNPFPLQWPEGWPRAPGDRAPKFAANFTDNRDTVIRRLRRRGSNIVITTDLPLNTRGLPYFAPVTDPGIAVYWFERSKSNDAAVERVVACDKWRRVDWNLRAIAKTLEAIDGIDRWGASQIVERMYAGFTALPAAGETCDGVPMPPATPQKRPWREVLGGGWPDDLDSDELFIIARKRHRAAMKLVHPDVAAANGAGDDHAAAAELNVAIAEAELELVASEVSP